MVNDNSAPVASIYDGQLLELMVCFSVRHSQI